MLDQSSTKRETYTALPRSVVWGEGKLARSSS